MGDDARRMASSEVGPIAAALARAAELERIGDLDGAVSACETAYRLSPDDPEIVASLASLAGRMGLPDVAAKLWEQVIGLQPERLEAVNGQARALRELGRFDEAAAVLRAALLANPQEPRLWNSLGLTLTQDSQAALAITFFDEAVRLDRQFAAAIYNRGGARFDLGDLEAARADFTQARAVATTPSDIATIAFATATLALARGDLVAGWDAYDARLSPDWPHSVAFQAPGRRWTPADPLAGARLLVMAEQGLGDEIMFANLVPDLLDELGPNGELSLAVEPRLVELFRRSFPGAQVSAHATERSGPRRLRTAPQAATARSADIWTPMASLPRRFRRAAQDFPTTPGYLRPDPARVRHWQGWLGAGPPAVGVTWRSGKVAGDRRRQYPPLGDWARLLRTPGVRFVNLQYGDCAEDLGALRAMGGAQILEPPDLDLREDIDGLAALCASLDMVVSVANATGALAGACGAPVVLICAPAAWPRLGSAGYPWYPSARVAAAPSFGAWEPAMAQAASWVAELAQHRAG